MGHDQKGFSLIELLIVVAIILILSAIAIPSLMRSRAAANEASALENLRAISTAEVTYSVTYGGGYSPSLTALGPPAPGQTASSTAAGLVDETLASGFKSGYSFFYTPALFNAATNSWDGYTLLANPATYGRTGSLYYYTDQSFVIRANTTNQASSTDDDSAVVCKRRGKRGRGRGGERGEERGEEHHEGAHDSTTPPEHHPREH